MMNARALTMDDHEASRSLMVELCRRKLPMVRVLTAASGHEALALAQAEQPAVVVLDVGLPDMSGAGIAGMQERLRPLDGRLTIESSDQGTCLCAVIPNPGANA